MVGVMRAAAWLALVLDWVTGELPTGYPFAAIQGARGTVQMPLYGIGTWQYNDTVAELAVTTALSLGYRHVDTALGYRNQVGVGKALRASNLSRKEYFVTSKIPGGLTALAAREALQQTLDELGLEYVDLMLLHFPGGVSGKAVSSPTLRQTDWQELETFANAGHARAIGVSHYCMKHIEDTLQVASLPIAVNQVQYHVGMGAAGSFSTDFKDYMESKGILYESFSPLCGPCGDPYDKELITGELVTEIGKAHNVTGAQVSLRWLVQQGIPVIPKSANPHHIKEDGDLFSFSLTAREMQMLSAATSPPVAGGPSNTSSGDCEIPRHDLNALMEAGLQI